MEQVKVYDHAGNEFLAPDQKAADAAVESGQYFFERPVESLADSLGLRAVAPAGAPAGGEAIEKDGNDRLFVYDEEGKRHSMWAVDAKECVKSGHFTCNAPVDVESVQKAPEKDKPVQRTGRGRTK